jgi:hypothetical protein
MSPLFHTGFTDAFEVAVYFIDVMSAFDDFIDVWTGDLNIDDRSAGLAQEMMVEFFVDIVP